MELIDHIFVYLSDNQPLANTIIGITGLFTAVAALIIAVLALIMVLCGLASQRRHHVRSVKPLPIVSISDFEDSLKVELENNGLGPLIVKSIRVSHVKDSRGKETRPSLHAWMPPLPQGMVWTSAVGALSGRSVAPGGRLSLIELNWDEAEGEIAFSDFALVRDAIRTIVRELAISVSHTDVYGTRMEPYERALG
jgi:hypothetical protein